MKTSREKLAISSHRVDTETIQQNTCSALFGQILPCEGQYIGKDMKWELSRN